MGAGPFFLQRTGKGRGDKGDTWVLEFSPRLHPPRDQSVQLGPPRTDIITHLRGKDLETSRQKA